VLRRAIGPQIQQRERAHQPPKNINDEGQHGASQTERVHFAVHEVNRAERSGDVDQQADLSHRQCERAQRREPPGIAEENQLWYQESEVRERHPRSRPWVRGRKLGVQIRGIGNEQQTQHERHARIARHADTSVEQDGEAEENELIKLKNSHERDERFPLSRCRGQGAAEREAARQHADGAQQVERISCM